MLAVTGLVGALRRRARSSTGVDLAVADGEIVAVQGPSGGGKTTLLRVIAGLLRPDAGRVAWDGEDLAGVPPHQRRFGLMFQDNQLFPHRDVGRNVGFGLRMQGRPRGRDRHAGGRAARPGRTARLRAPQGGHAVRWRGAAGGAGPLPRPRAAAAAARRAARARSTASSTTASPPTSATSCKRLGIPAVHVTHDPEEAAVVADRVVRSGLNAVEAVQPASCLVGLERSSGVSPLLDRAHHRKPDHRWPGATTVEARGGRRAHRGRHVRPAPAGAAGRAPRPTDVTYPEDGRPGTFHLGVRDAGGPPIAIATFCTVATPWRPDRPAVQLRGMAVEPGRQRGGLGRGSSSPRPSSASRPTAPTCSGPAPATRALGFYERLGMEVVGDGYIPTTPACLTTSWCSTS